MTALLGLIPLKDWIYTGLIVALIIGAGVAVKHERDVGAAKVVAADAKVVAVQQKHDLDVQAAASAASQKAMETYNAQLTAALQPVPSLVCYRAAPSRRAVPAPASSAGSSSEITDVPEATGPSFNPAERILAVGRQADAQVTLLQSLIRSYQAAGVVAK